MVERDITNLFFLQPTIVLRLKMKTVYQVFRTIEEVESRGTESHGDIKSSFLATSLTVMKCVETSQSGG